MRLPSLAGVGAAMHVFGCDAVGPVANRDRCQSCLPSAAAKARTCSRSCRGPLDAVTNTRSPTTTGDDAPRPGSGIFHATPLSAATSDGGAGPSATAVPPGPRNCRQSAPAVKSARAANRAGADYA